MKFEDIETFPRATYKVNIFWSYLKEWLNSQGESFDLQLDPPFQRGYKWTDHQKTSYIEYRLRGGFSGKDLFWNCPGWQGSSDKGDPLQLVDGKQRLNAVLEFLDNKVTVFDGVKLSDFDGKIPGMRYDFVFHINNLESQSEVVDWYLGLNTGGSIHTEEDLKSAYVYRRELLRKIAT